MVSAMRRVLVPLLILLTAVAGAQTYTGKVVGVTDGDTLTVLDGTKKQHKVRLWGIDAPENGQPFGAAAKKRLGELVFSKSVTLVVKDKDRYGRLVAIVEGFPDEKPIRSGKIEVVLNTGQSRVINELMVRDGYAWWYRQYAPRSESLQSLERGARSRKVGLWSDGKAVAPWDWRGGSGRAPAAAAKPQPAATQRIERTVYVTRSGSKYHAEGCRYLRSSSIPMKISDATQSYDACSVCGGG
jgi:micrococcal nuclease